MAKEEQTDNTPTTTYKVGAHSNSSLFIIIAIIASLAFGACIGLAVGHALSAPAQEESVLSRSSHELRGKANGFGQRFDQNSNKEMNQLRGVVTAVDGANFTLGGNGTTVTVTTNDKTKYSGTNTRVAVNDTVIVTYSGNSTTPTATMIRIANIAK